MKILLIAGHGAGDPGAVGNGYTESILTREAALALKPLLMPFCNTVDIYDTSRNAFWDLGHGVSLPFGHYDFVLELHFNAYNEKSANGTEIYVPRAETDTRAAKQILNAVCLQGFSNRGVKQEDYAVIAAAKKKGVFAALLELCFITNAADMARYAEKRDAALLGIANAIAAAFGLSKKEDTKDAAGIVQEKAGLENETMSYLLAYTYGKDLIQKLAEAMK